MKKNPDFEPETSVKKYLKGIYKKRLKKLSESEKNIYRHIDNFKIVLGNEPMKDFPYVSIEHKGLFYIIDNEFRLNDGFGKETKNPDDTMKWLKEREKKDELNIKVTNFKSYDKECSISCLLSKEELISNGLYL